MLAYTVMMISDDLCVGGFSIVLHWQKSLLTRPIFQSVCADYVLRLLSYLGYLSLGNTALAAHDGVCRIVDNSLHSEAALIVGGWFASISRLRYLDISK